ncbi:MAG: hypothetical protein ABSG63_01325 [Spirochaetia bacterium]|jgi:hypothetical protein
MPGTPELDSLTEIFARAGRVFPTTSYPVSKAELSRFADMLAENASDRTAEELASYRTDILKYDTETGVISVDAAGSFEYTLRSQNVNFDPGLPAEWQVLDFHRLFADQLPLGSLSLDYSRDSSFEIGISALVQREYLLDPFNPTNLWESDPSNGNPLAIENQDIMQGFLWFDLHPLQVTFGRDQIDIGPARTSLLPSRDLPFLDMLRLRLPLGRLTGDLVISTLENRQRGPDVTLVTGDPPFGSTIILMAMHRWEYGFDAVRLGIAALCVYARNGNAYNLGDIFPVFSWHQANIGPNHTTLVADASWSPLPRLLLTAQGGLQSLNLSAVDVHNQPVPTVPAGIVSADYLFALPKDLALDLYLEVGATHYLWGNFSPDPDGNPDALAKAIDRYYLDGGNVLLPLTSPYGPGALWVELAATLHGLPWLETSVNARYFSRMTDPSTDSTVSLAGTPYVGDSTIESAPHVDTWSIGAEAAAFPFGFLKVFVAPTMYIQVDNRSGSYKTWLELALGVSVIGGSKTRIAQHL